MDSLGLLGRRLLSPSMGLLSRLMGLLSLPHVRSMLDEAAGSLRHISHDVLEARCVCAQEVAEVVEEIFWICGLKELFLWAQHTDKKKTRSTELQ